MNWDSQLISAQYVLITHCEQDTAIAMLLGILKAGLRDLNQS